MLPADCLLYALAAIGHSALWVGFVNRAHGTALPRWAIRWLSLAGVAGFFAGFAALGFFGWTTGFQLIGRTDWSGVPWSLRFYFVLSVAAAPVVAALWGVHRWIDRPGRIVLDQSSECHDLRAAALEGVESAVMRRLIQFPLNEAARLAVTHKTLYLARLPAELDGFSIAHLSDLHFTGRVGKRYFSEVVDRVLEMDADMIALTGDIMDYARYMAWLPDTVQRLAARHGAYFVLGNHDLYVPVPRLRSLLTSAGLVDLGSQTATIDVRGQRVALAGNELPWIAPGPELSRLPAEAGLRIALSHGPDQFGWGRRHGFDLLLAGHNHGGQVRLPVLGAVACPSRYGARYACGVFYAPPTVMHVSRGVSGELPLRWNCSAEISLLTLAASRTRRSQQAERPALVGERQTPACR